MVPALSAQSQAPTRRLGFVYIANGVIQNQWNPATTGAGFELTPILRPFANGMLSTTRAMNFLAPKTMVERKRASQDEPEARRRTIALKPSASHAAPSRLNRL